MITLLRGGFEGCLFCCLPSVILFCSVVCCVQAQDMRHVQEPHKPPPCVILHARLTAVHGILPVEAEGDLDTERIQQVLDHCDSGIVGRTPVIATLATRARQRRSVTIVGPGGIGKTSVVDAAAGIAEKVLQGAPGLHLLATSREPLSRHSGRFATVGRVR